MVTKRITKREREEEERSPFPSKQQSEGDRHQTSAQPFTLPE
ncbi:hypothetical protein [Leptolyngbya sp. O-77]|nr:hypothetical protein [Leptolyngbya sp. O-77]